MRVCDSTVLEQEAINEHLIEVKRPTEGFDMALRQLIVHQAELPVHHLGKQWNRQITVFLADLEVGELGVLLILDD